MVRGTVVTGIGLDLGPLVVRNAPAMKEDARAGPLRRHGQMNRPADPVDQPPELSGRAVTQHGAGAAREHGGNPARQCRLERPQPIHTSMERLQPPGLKPVLDIRFRQPELNQLRPANDTVLPARHLENRHIQTTRGVFPLIINGN